MKIFFLTLFVFFPRSYAAFFERDLPNEIIYAFNIQAMNVSFSTLNVGMISPTNCPATLISPFTVMVVAHCLYNGSAQKYHNVNVITFNYADTDSTLKSVQVEQMIPFSVPRRPPTHLEDFSSVSDYARTDLAVLKLKEPVTPPNKIVIGIEETSLTKTTLAATLGFPVLNNQAVLLMDKCNQWSLFHDSIYRSNCSAAIGSSGGPIVSLQHNSTNFVNIIGILTAGGSARTAEERIPYTEDIATISLMFIEGQPATLFLQRQQMQDNHPP